MRLAFCFFQVTGTSKVQATKGRTTVDCTSEVPSTSFHYAREYSHGDFPRHRTCSLRLAYCSFQVAGTSKVQATNGLRGALHLIPHGPERTAEFFPGEGLVICAWPSAFFR